MTYRVLRLRGIAETTDTMLENITRHLPSTQFHCTEVTEWSAQFGPFPRLDGQAYEDSLRVGLDGAVRLIALSPDPVILLGFSAGAELAGNVAAYIAARRPDLSTKLVLVVLVADPLRPRHHGFPGYGIRGERNIHPSIRTIWVAADEDAITCCDDDSLLRPYVKPASRFSLINPASWGVTLTLALAAAQVRALLSGVAIARDRGRRARRDVRGYLTGSHTVAYTRPRFGGSLLERATRDVISEVNA